MRSSYQSLFCIITFIVPNNTLYAENLNPTTLQKPSWPTLQNVISARFLNGLACIGACACFFACFAIVLMVPYESSLIKYYVGLAIFSCLLVTKDEFVHKHHCPAAEQWLHAILFVNHSVLLAAMGLMWPKLSGVEIFSWLPSAESLKPFLWFQIAFAAIFCLYQIVYWNFFYKEKSYVDF